MSVLHAMKTCRTCTHYLPNAVLEEGNKLAKFGYDGLCARPGLWMRTYGVKETMVCGYHAEPTPLFKAALASGVTA
jgi:hypothetical protein